MRCGWVESGVCEANTRAVSRRCEALRSIRMAHHQSIAPLTPLARRDSTGGDTSTGRTTPRSNAHRCSKQDGRGEPQQGLEFDPGLTRCGFDVMAWTVENVAA